MLSIFELNIGHSIYGKSDAAMPLIDILGQGDGIKVCAHWFARARRTNPEAEKVFYGCAWAASLVQLARQQHPMMTDDQAADLVAYIFERGVNLGRAA